MPDETGLADGFAIIELIGRGGSSSVYRAHQVAFDREVALKILDVDPSDPDMRRRFERECAAAGRVSDHPNIVTILASGTTRDGRPYLATELCPAGSLAARLRSGPLRVDAALSIGVKLCGALGTAHAAGILHRDVKPENVLLTAFGEPALIDFGIATIGGQEPSTTTRGSFTLHHAAPETLTGGEVTAAADVYGLASTLHHLLTGRAPFAPAAGTPLATVLDRILHAPPPPVGRPDVPPSLDALLAQGLAKDPAARPAGAAAFGAALQQIQRELGLPVTELLVLTDRGATGTTPVVVVPPAAPDATPAPPAPAATVLGGRHAAPGHQPAAPPAPPTPPPTVPVAAIPAPPAPPAVAALSGEATVMGGSHALASAPPGAPDDDPSRRRRGVVVLVVLALVALGGLAFLLLRGGDDGRATDASTGGATTTAAAVTTTSGASATTTTTGVAVTGASGATAGTGTSGATGSPSLPGGPATTAPRATFVVSEPGTIPNGDSASSTTAPATTAPATTAPPTTAPPTTAPPTTAPPTTAAPRLAVTKITANPLHPVCNTTVTISWTTTLAASVTIGIGNPGAYQTGLPPNGSLEVPFSCDIGQSSVTYYVIARGANGVDASTSTLTVTAAA